MENAKQQFEANTRVWSLGYHHTALTTKDLSFARELYEARIEALNKYIRFLEQEVAKNGTKKQAT